MADEGFERGGKGVEMSGWFVSLLLRDFLRAFMATAGAERWDP